MDDPATAPWDLSISDDDFRKLKAGFKPMDMDDRWIISADLGQDGDMSVIISRSWTRKEHYILAIKSMEGGMKIEAITWEQDKGGIHISEEQGKKEAIILCKSLLGCKFDTLPDYGTSLLVSAPIDAN